jgi:hypothetical protein
LHSAAAAGLEPTSILTDALGASLAFAPSSLAANLSLKTLLSSAA